jgi:hypothetical protein
MASYGYYRFLNLSFLYLHLAQMLWTGESNSIIYYGTLLKNMTATLYLTSLSVSLVRDLRCLTIMHSPFYRPTCSRFRFKGCSRNIHGLPYDGISTRKGEELSVSTCLHNLINRRQWVNDVADAGGSLYCFHLEATSQ